MMSPRNLILLGVAALVGSALLLGFTAAGAPDEETLRTLIAEFLEIDADDIEGLWEVSTDRHGKTDGWARFREGIEEGIEARFATRRIDGKVHITQMTRMFDLGEEDIGIERARAKALAFAESKYARWGPDMVETYGRRVPLGNYMFDWQRITEESYLTGDRVSVSLDSATGEVFSYGAGFATRSTRPRIDAEEATKIALEHLQEQERVRHPGIAIEVIQARCVLSPTQWQGPLWFIHFEITFRDFISREAVIVDGLTGDIVTWDDLR